MDTAQTEVTALVGDWIRAENQRGKSYKAIADELEVSKTHVIKVRDGDAKVGADLETRFASLQYGGSIDKLREAARAAWAKRHAGGSVVTDEDLARYPGLAVLAGTAFFKTAPEPVKARVLSWRSSLGDAKASAWFALFESLLERHRAGKLDDAP